MTGLAEKTFMDEVRVDVAADPGVSGYEEAAGQIAARTLGILGEKGELSVLFVGDERMAELNRNWRGRSGPTDVLAFAQREGPALGEEGLLGDVVICVPTAQRQAAERGHGIDREIEELLVHGILHLLGYDHEISADEARRMFAKQAEVLSALRGRSQGRF